MSSKRIRRSRAGATSRCRRGTTRLRRHGQGWRLGGDGARGRRVTRHEQGELRIGTRRLAAGHASGRAVVVRAASAPWSCSMWKRGVGMRGTEAADEVERVERDGVGFVLPCRFEAHLHTPVGLRRQPLLRERRPGDVAVRALDPCGRSRPSNATLAWVLTLPTSASGSVGEERGGPDERACSSAAPRRCREALRPRPRPRSTRERGLFVSGRRRRLHRVVDVRHRFLHRFTSS